jgi:hypothetical protein
MKIENRQQFLLMLTIVVVALSIGDLLVYEPLAKWWSSRSRKSSALRKGEATAGHCSARAGIRSRWATCARTRCRPTRRWPSSRCSGRLTTGAQESGADHHGHHAAMEKRLDELHDAQLPRGGVRHARRVEPVFYDIENRPDGAEARFRRVQRARQHRPATHARPANQRAGADIANEMNETDAI